MAMKTIRQNGWHYGGKGIFKNSNFIAGSSFKGCVKLYVNGVPYFLSVEDSHSLVTDLNNRLDKYNKHRQVLDETRES